MVLWPNKSDVFFFLQNAQVQKAPIKASPIIIPFNFFSLLSSKPKTNQQKPIGHWEPGRIFLSKASNENPRPREDQKTQVKAKKLQAKAEAEGARPMFLAEDIDQKKPWKKRQMPKLSHNIFIFVAEQGILRILREFWKCYEKRDGIKADVCQLVLANVERYNEKNRFSRRNGQATWLRRSPKRQQMRSMQKI